MSWTSDKVSKMSTPDKGVGLFANAPIKKGELLVVTTGKVITSAEAVRSAMPLHCFQVELGLELAPTSLDLSGIFATNHSCDPNAGIRNATTLVAMRDIAAGEEICFDYAMTDCTMSHTPSVEMDCLCGSSSCRKLVTNVDWRLPSLQERYDGYFSTYLAEIIQKEYGR